jgi:hypothetical protein
MRARDGHVWPKAVPLPPVFRVLTQLRPVTISEPPLSVARFLV